MLMKEKEWPLSVDTFQLIMQSCLNYASPEMAVKIYNCLPLYNVKANGSICSIYFKAMVQQSNSQQRAQGSARNQPATVRSSRVTDCSKIDRGSLDVRSAKYKSAVQQFRERTFFTEEEMNMVGDRVAVSGDRNQCSACEARYKYEDLRKIVSEMGGDEEDVIEVICSKCSKPMIPNIHVRMGNRYTFSEPDVPTYMERAVILMFPRVYKKNVERLALQSNNTVKIEVKRYKTFYQGIFWNSIWHFSRLNLPYDLFLPYKKEICFEGLVQTVSQVTISAVRNWEAEDKGELAMQKKYEENMKKKISYKHMGIQVSEPVSSKSKEIKA
eukprot:TRINITY_DN6016_c0_g2_i6.p2 TRINITY_DN6016_c0_g2~~TRINITY_DN6016_c0_g2_i6.p2  ORF type:complete len:327 (+),score=78.37 TRINITY_DN6016_c0_g2_i6:2333-3313(+)